MKPIRLKISSADFEELRQLVLQDMPREAGAFALAGIANQGDSLDVLVRRPLSIPRDMSPVQLEYHLELAMSSSVVKVSKLSE